MIRSRLRYYFSSLPVLVRGFRNWPLFFSMLVGLPRRRPVTMVLRESGLRFRVRTALEAWVLKEAALDRQYEAGARPIENGWTVVDVGAGIGDFALDLAYRHPQCSVFAFEPNPASFELLLENQVTNRISNLFAYPHAIGARAERRQLASGEVTARLVTGPGDSQVQASTLGALLQALAVERCDFLKMDCEGCEFEALLGADADTLDRVQNLCLEFHEPLTGRSHRELAEHLRAHGFEVRITPSPVHRGLGLLAGLRR